MTHTLRFPRFCCLLLSFALAYVLYHAGLFDRLPEYVDGYGYLSMFFGGLLFSFGFTSPFAIVIFVAMAKNVHPIPGAMIAGFGALLVDFSIFEFIRVSFVGELRQLRAMAWYHRMRRLFHHRKFSERVRQYFLLSVAGLVIASPLPDELGVTLMSGVTDVDERKFSILCFIFNTLGILTVLLLTRAIG